MRQFHSVPRRLALVMLGIVGFTIAATVTAARPANRYTAAINGPATVEDDYTCTWTASTDITDPIYEWQGPYGVVIGSDASVSYAYDRANGAHQILKLSIRNAAGASASTYRLVGVYISGSGDPECP